MTIHDSFVSQFTDKWGNNFEGQSCDKFVNRLNFSLFGGSLSLSQHEEPFKVSEIRFNSPNSPSYLAGAPKAPGGLNVPHCAPPGTLSSTPNLSTGSVEQLMANYPRAHSSVLDAAPLLNLQSHTASQFTNPSSTPKEPENVSGWDAFRGASTGNAILKGLTRASSRLGRGTRGIGSVAGLAGAAVALPSGISSAISSIEKAFKTGERSDIAQAGADTTGAASTAARLAKHSLETANLGSKAIINHSTAKAFKQAAPGASKAVVKAAARQATEEVLKESGEKLAKRAATAAATTAAKSGGTLAKGAGAVGRTAAKKILQEGGEAAAKAATKAVAKGALKTGAKAAGRFVPGLNIAIAGLDTATAVATLADPKAGTGKKVTSVITAAGSIVAATNIPVVSQVGAAVSTVSSFIGSFF